MGLGATRATTLAEARDKADECRRLMRQGLDPIEEQRRSKAAQRLSATRALTFDEAATQCIAAKKPEWSNQKHAAQWTSTLSAYASPVLGKLSVADIDTTLVQQVLDPIWKTKTEIRNAVATEDRDNSPTGRRQRATDTVRTQQR